VEIKPNKKSIPNYNKGSILLPVKYGSSGKLVGENSKEFQIQH
jgi:hypothetical protein